MHYYGFTPAHHRFLITIIQVARITFIIELIC